MLRANYCKYEYHIWQNIVEISLYIVNVYVNKCNYTFLQYWLCERAAIFDPRSDLEDKTLRAVRWDLQNISRALTEIDLNDLNADIVSF